MSLEKVLYLFIATCSDDLNLYSYEAWNFKLRFLFLKQWFDYDNAIGCFILSGNAFACQFSRAFAMLIITTASSKLYCLANPCATIILFAFVIVTSITHDEDILFALYMHSLNGLPLFTVVRWYLCCDV